ncbi:expressed unknown protein [Ectocarpus siliculosus]|uniref:Uncharacterized protein n=1 Tax=Ectocarpus siliculosus TaxID=2880 RepID=D7FWS5_ECTSI|nr:expressed unknown protein [Ectocarpus siliculosus]|eukprot:CBJ32163.1 expressed unknown protein [Ectocarpus siliculosus]
MAQLKLTSFRQLVEAFTLIGIPGGVLGFWQAEAPTLSWDVQQQQQGGLDGATVQEREARGELLRITLEAGGFLCESIAPNGTRRRIFTIRVSKTPTDRINIGFFCLEKESSLTIGGDDDSWVPGDSMAEALARYTFAVPGSTKRTPMRASGTKAFFLERNDGRTCRYVKLTAPPASSPGVVAAAGAVKNLCGLWCAPYGSHGLEIIQLSTDPSCSPDEETAAAAAAAAVKAATVAKLSSLSQSWAGGRGGPRGSVSGCSTSRMTDGSESVCTSTPATDADGSEAGSCDEAGGSSEAAAAAAAGGGDDDSSDGDGDGDVESVLDDVCLASIARRKGNSLHHADTGTAGSGAGAGDASVPSQLFGFKVTGDDNVPAGKTSFVIDLSTDFDVDEELRSDSRPVVTFLPTGAVMANLANRRQQISCWRNGRGQINRVPGRWSPEWVDVEFVEYRAGSRCAFSVIFRQPNQAVRVVMDFERALGCEEEWPQWSAAAPAPACAAGAAAAAGSDSPSTSAASGGSVASSFDFVFSQQQCGSGGA